MNKKVILASFIVIVLVFLFILYLGNKRQGKDGGQNISRCKVGGCSSELCLDEAAEDIYSICIYNPVYDCYKTARCERQANGKCGWTQTAELKICLEEKNAIQPSF